MTTPPINPEHLKQNVIKAILEIDNFITQLRVKSNKERIHDSNMYDIQILLERLRKLFIVACEEKDKEVAALKSEIETQPKLSKQKVDELVGLIMDKLVVNNQQYLIDGHDGNFYSQNDIVNQLRTAITNFNFQSEIDSNEADRHKAIDLIVLQRQVKRLLLFAEPHQNKILNGYRTSEIITELRNLVNPVDPTDPPKT